MNKGHGALLGACLALPLAGAVPGLAAQPPCGPQGQGAAIEPMTVAEQVQAGRLIADANTMFRQMDAEMNAMQAQMAALMEMPLLTPQLVQASFGPGGWIAAGPGTGTVITEVSTGNGGTCSETITYSYHANGGRPIVHVSQSGDACEAVIVNGRARVQAARPAPRRRSGRPCRHSRGRGYGKSCTSGRPLRTRVEASSQNQRADWRAADHVVCEYSAEMSWLV